LFTKDSLDHQSHIREIIKLIPSSVTIHENDNDYNNYNQYDYIFILRNQDDQNLNQDQDRDIDIGCCFSNYVLSKSIMVIDKNKNNYWLDYNYNTMKYIQCLLNYIIA
jgi:hypothetical protein